jgi:RNA polymerase sigma factor (sigma-70 family)
MVRTTISPVLRHIRKLVADSTARQTTDVELLRRFGAERDEDAFAELMRRHGPLVLRVCRRVLGHEQEAEDAFQAAFLVLARRAESIRKGESVGSFLYGVAYRIALKERGKRSQRLRREQHQQQPMPTSPVSEVAFRELQMLLDEGLNRLPEKYRTPFVLCCLEGKSKSEAARELGWKEGTVSSRLAQARKELKQFLSQNGVTLTAALTATGIAENAATACVSPLLAASTLRTAMSFASAAPAMLEMAKAVQLAESALGSMTSLPWKAATALLLTVCLVAGGAGLAHRGETAKPAPASKLPQTTPGGTQRAERQDEKARTDRYGDPLPEGALARLGTVRFRQGSLVRQVAFSPDGKMVACAGSGRGICLWDAATGKELRQIGAASEGLALAFSPDGKHLLCVFDAKGGGTARYETATGRKAIALPDGVGGFPIGLAYAPDGKTIAAGESRSNRIQFFDAATGAKRKMEIRADKPDEVFKIAWSPDSKKLTGVGHDGSVRLWDAIEAKELAQWKAHEKEIYSVAFSPDGKTLATGSEDETICLWDVATHKRMHTLDGKHRQVRSLIFDREGSLLASGHRDGTIALWDASQGKEIRRWLAHPHGVATLDFSPDGKTLVSGSACGPRLWDVATGTEARPFSGHTAAVFCLSFSPDGKRMRSLGIEMKLLDWDVTNWRQTPPLKRLPPDKSTALRSYVFSPRGDVAVSFEKDGAMRLWDVAAEKERATLGKLNRKEVSGGFGSVELSPDGRLLAIGLKSGGAVIWDTTAGVERWRLKGSNPYTLCLAFSGDGKKLAVGSAGGKATIGLWDLTTGKNLVDFPSKVRIDSLAFSPDAKVLASTSSASGSSTQLWNAATGRLLRSFASAPLHGAAISPDGKWLAGTGDETGRKVHVWEVSTGLEVRAFPGHPSGALSIAFAPDGRMLASGGVDSTILLWDFTGRMKDGRLQTAKWTLRELEKRWIDLASNAGPQAVQALWDLVASPEQSVPLLRQRIKPIEPADAKRVQRLMNDLDSEDFPTRNKATQELKSIVEGAAPALQKRLAEKPSLEMRQRIKQILDSLDPSADPKRLRELRSIQVLEYIGTPEARDYLRALLKGIAEARLTSEAKAALERLAK